MCSQLVLLGVLLYFDEIQIINSGLSCIHIFTFQNVKICAQANEYRAKKLNLGFTLHFIMTCFCFPK